MDEVIQGLLDLLENVMQDSENISDQEWNQILAFFAQAIELIQEQESESQIGAIPEDLPQSEYPSSNVNGFQYDPESKKLMVQFHGPYPNSEGPIYSYDNVPGYLYDAISRGRVSPKTSGKNKYHEWIKDVTPSLGASVNAILKAGGFPYKKLS